MVSKTKTNKIRSNKRKQSWPSLLGCLVRHIKPILAAENYGTGRQHPFSTFYVHCDVSRACTWTTYTSLRSVYIEMLDLHQHEVSAMYHHLYSAMIAYIHSKQYSNIYIQLWRRWCINSIPTQVVLYYFSQFRLVTYIT